MSLPLRVGGFFGGPGGSPGSACELPRPHDDIAAADDDDGDVDDDDDDDDGDGDQRCGSALRLRGNDGVEPYSYFYPSQWFLGKSSGWNDKTNKFIVIEWIVNSHRCGKKKTWIPGVWELTIYWFYAVHPMPETT